MKKITIIIIGIILAYAAFAQRTDLMELQTNYPDSLVLTTDSQNEVTFLFNRMSRNKAYFSEDLWKSMLAVMETAVERSDIQEGIRVVYEVAGSETAQITITKLEPAKSTFLINKEGMKEVLSSRVEFLIIQPQVAVAFTVQNGPELVEMKDLKVESVWSQLREKYSDEGKNNLYKGKGKIRYGTVTIDEISDRRPKLDNLELTFLGVGIGYYRDRFVPDIGSKIAVKLHNRLGKEWMDIGVLYTNQFLYEQNESNDFNLSPNGWLTGFWKLHMPGGEEFGVGVGGLIHRKGDFYQGATYKLSIYNKGANSRFTFSPEFVFTNDFKSFFPALRFGLSF